MPTSVFSRGHRRKPGSEPAPEPTPPSRQSGGTSGDLSIPGYVPETPTVYLPPSESGLAIDTDPATATISTQPHETDPRALAAELLSGEAVSKDKTINDLLNADVPTIGEKKDAINHLREITERLRKKEGGDLLPGLGKGESKVARTVLGEGIKDHASKRDLLAAAETGLVESGFKNLGYGDADSQGWRQERSQYYDNPRNVAASADRFFSELKTDPGAPEAPTAGLAAQAAQASAYPERYDERKPEAWDIVKSFKEGSQGHPKLEHALDQAKQTAIQAGVSPDKVGDIVHSEPKTKTVAVRADAKGMVQWADHLVGTQEGAPKQVSWEEHFGIQNQPWCANFISNGLARRGFKDLPANPNYVPSYEEWANEGAHAVNIGTDFSKAKPGDLVAFSGNHIGLYIGNGEMISGNFGDEVAQSPVSADSSPVSMIIRPKYQGGTVEVPVETANSGWGVASGSAVASESTLSGGAAEGNPILNAALNKTGEEAPEEEGNLASVIGFLDAPRPEIGKPLQPLNMDDDLLKLALRRRG